MSINRVVAISAVFLAAGFVCAEEPVDAPEPKNYGYHNTLIQEGKTALLIQLLPQEKGDKPLTVNAKVLADLHGKIKEGTTIKIRGQKLVPFSGGITVNLPTGYDPLDKDVIYVWPVEKEAPGKYKYLDEQGDFPIGLDSDKRIALSDLDDVKAAFKELQAAIETPGHDGPSIEHATELLKSKNYYKFALGVWRLAHETNAANVAKLKKLFTNGDISLAQAIWVEDVLSAYMTGKEPLPRLTMAELAGLLSTYLHQLADKHPEFPNGVAPAPAPSRFHVAPQDLAH